MRNRAASDADYAGSSATQIVGTDSDTRPELHFQEASMPHLVLLGDSIFDNGVYVPGQPCVTDQISAVLGADWQVTRIAVDGHKTLDVINQLKQLPKRATHLAISVGGNDALEDIPSLQHPVGSITGALEKLTLLRDVFQSTYRFMLQEVSTHQLPMVCCTVYDRIPVLAPHLRTALALYNEVITREAAWLGVPAVDLRVLCDQPEDYSEQSEIEPSVQGGEKIAAGLAQVLSDQQV